METTKRKIIHWSWYKMLNYIHIGSECGLVGDNSHKTLNLREVTCIKCLTSKRARKYYIKRLKGE